MRVPGLLLFGLAAPSVAMATGVAGVPPPRAVPVMAWNAWNTFSINGRPMRGGRKEYQTIADAMVESGMVAAGYTLMSTVCTDWIGRDPVTHELQQNLTLWPGGMKSFADDLHSKGMTLSVYTDAGTHNCCGEPGSLGYEDIDMQTFASWGADAIGVDYCGGPPGVEPEYEKIADAIVKSGRNMQLEVWNLGRGAMYQYAPSMSQNMTAASHGTGVFNASWVPHMRLTGDIGNYWSGKISNTESLIATVNQIQGIGDLWDYGMGNSSGTYPNYGQMIVGVPPDHPTLGDPGLTLVEAQSHFSMWCMFPTILMATNDVRLRDKAIENILLNPETIAVNQDPWASPAVRIINPAGCGGTQWARPLANGDIAVLILNLESTPINTTLSWSSAMNDTSSNTQFRVRDVQTRSTSIGLACQHASFTLAAHETAFVRLTKVPGACTPTPGPACTAPPPAPPPPPVPSPLPPCPNGFTDHPSGYWADPDQKIPTGHGKTVMECGAYCKGKQGCAAFEVYDPNQVTEPISKGGSACYTFSSGLNQFQPDTRGLIRTCVKQ